MGLLRVLLGLSVFAAHSSFAENMTRSSGIAIECFFVISGFYLQLVLASKYTEARLGPRWRLIFYQARILRLYPMYLLACGLVLTVSLTRPYLGPMPVWDYVAALPPTIGNLAFQGFLVLTNLTLLFQDATMFLSAQGHQIVWSSTYWITDAPLWRGLLVPQAWSLGVEMSFVLLAPMLLNLRTRWLCAILATSLGCKLILVLLQGEHDPWSFRFFPFELGYFLLGALAFRFRKHLDHPLPASFDAYVALAVPFAFVTLMAPFKLDHFVYPLVLALMIPFLFRQTGQSQADRIIGEFSYPFYLFHIFILEVSHLAAPKLLHASAITADAIALVASFAVSGAALVIEAQLIKPIRAGLAASQTAQPTNRIGAAAG